MNRPPLREVARRAGVSEPTVSRVLNGRTGVASATRHRVVEALESLGFTEVPEPGSPRRGAVGVICGELTNPVFPAIAHTIIERLARHDLVATLGVATTDLFGEERYVEEFLAVGVDGIVFVAGRHAELPADLQLYRDLVDREIPIVLVNGGETALPVPHVWSDEGIAAQRGVEHLSALGHTRIGCVLGSRRYRPTHRFIEGYERAMGALGLELIPIVETAFTLEGGRAGARRLLSDDVTGLICANDLMAMGAVAAARTSGRSVPADVSVIGYDGTDSFATTDPPLTTLRQPFADMGDMVAEALRSEIIGARRFRDHYVFAPELVARASTGAARQTVVPVG